MPLDPSILQGIKLPQIRDPMEQYQNMLVIRQAQNQLAKYDQEQADQNALNQVMRQSIDPVTGKLDYGKAMGLIGSLGQGHQFGTIQKAQFEAQKAAQEASEADDKRRQAGLTATKTQVEMMSEEEKLVKARIDSMQPLLAAVTTPDEYIGHWGRIFEDPLTTSVLESRGVTMDNMKGLVQSVVDKGQFNDFLRAQQFGTNEAAKGQFFQRNIGNENVITRVPELGSGAPQHVSRLPIGKSLNIPQTKIETTLVQEGEKAGVVAAWKKAADRDDAMSEAAYESAEVARKADRMLDSLESRDPLITGFAADFRLDVAKAFGLVTGDTTAIPDTEELKADLASVVLGAIRTLGIGARGLDTPAERKFLENFAGKPALERETLIRLAKTLRDVAKRRTDRWSTRYKSLPAEGKGAYEPPPTISERKTKSSVAKEKPPPIGTIKKGEDGDYRFKGGDRYDKRNWEKVPGKRPLVNP